MRTLTVSVVVPWRPDGGHRDAAWQYLAWRWTRTHPHWQIVTGAAPDGPWCKAAAVAAALPGATGDVLVIADADVWCDGVDQAVSAVANGAGWAVPHDLVHRLTEDATAAVRAGGPLRGPSVERPYRGYAGGGMTVLDRETYQQVPLDPRFAGWGQEDEAWALALGCLAGAAWRGSAPLWHLWHPPQARTSRRWGSDASRALWARYRIAATDPAAMRVLLDEGRTPCPASPTSPRQLI